jgi:hypothetical protein
MAQKKRSKMPTGQPQQKQAKQPPTISVEEIRNLTDILQKLTGSMSGAAGVCCTTLPGVCCTTTMGTGAMGTGAMGTGAGGVCCTTTPGVCCTTSMGGGQPGVCCTTTPGVCCTA